MPDPNRPVRRTKVTKPPRKGRAMGCLRHRSCNRADTGCEPCAVLLLVNQSRPGYGHPKPKWRSA